MSISVRAYMLQKEGKASSKVFDALATILNNSLLISKPTQSAE